MSQIKKIPDGYHSITPTLIVKNGVNAIEFYKKVFESQKTNAYDDTRWKSISPCRTSDR